MQGRIFRHCYFISLLARFLLLAISQISTYRTRRTPNLIRQRILLLRRKVLTQLKNPHRRRKPQLVHFQLPMTLNRPLFHLPFLPVLIYLLPLFTPAPLLPRTPLPSLSLLSISISPAQSPLNPASGALPLGWRFQSIVLPGCVRSCLPAVRWTQPACLCAGRYRLPAPRARGCP